MMGVPRGGEVRRRPDADASDPVAPAARQPIFNVPPVTKALLIVNVAVQAIRLLLPHGLDNTVIIAFGFVPARYTVARAFLGWPAFVDPITYQLLHGNLTHLGMNMLSLLAFGAGVERRIGGWRMLVFALLCGIASAAAHLAVYPTSLAPVIGASGAISGLFGGVLRFRFGDDAGHGGTLWPLIGLWIVMNVVTGQVGVAGADGESIAWVAHLGGFLAGLLLFDLFDRDAARRGQ